MTPERESKFRRVISQRKPDLTIVLEDIEDPHNISAILRTADAVGIYEVYIISSRGPRPKFGKRSSASARKWVKSNHFTSVESCYSALREKGLAIYSTKLSESTSSLYDLNLTLPCALVFGNEQTGVSEEAANMSDRNFAIPMSGMIPSLNVSVACAVTMYEAYRQRLFHGSLNQLEPEISEQTFIEWASK